VLEGCDGQDGIAKLDGRTVHLIVSDVNMPRVDGLTFLKAVKALPNYRFTPVIMLTTESGDAKKDAGRAAGARAWIVKPFNPSVLLDAVAKLCLP
jgi:two-component system chemotaxis response regulator CheY